MGFIALEILVGGIKIGVVLRVSLSATGKNQGGLEIIKCGYFMFTYTG